VVLNLDNERRYLRSLVAMGGGKAIWARQQAKKYGISLSRNTYVPLVADPVNVAKYDEPNNNWEPPGPSGVPNSYIPPSYDVPPLGNSGLVALGAVLFALFIFKK
jgi:hypothetical protein